MTAGVFGYAGLMWERLIQLVTGRTRAQQEGREADVQHDPAQANRRPTGGADQPGAQDAHSTTGPSANETFVGRVSGEDPGYAGETGAERRAQQ
jgi:hypothetical protein